MLIAPCAPITAPLRATPACVGLRRGVRMMTNEEAKILLVNLYAEWYKGTYDNTSSYSEAVAVAISALERAGGGDG